MISGIISLALQAIVPLINLFIRNAQKNAEMKAKMFKMVEDHSKNVMKNVSIRRDLEELRAQARKPVETKKDENRVP